MKARWLTLIACAPLIVGTMLLQSCGGVGGPTNPASSPGSNAPTQAFLALLPASQKGARVVGPAVCGKAACHGGSTAAHAAMHLASLQPAASGTSIYSTWQQTGMAKKNVTCESCHGPGSIHASKPTASDGTPNAILAFPNIAAPVVCGQCHGPEMNDWQTSMHSQIISDGVSASSLASSMCAECHGGLVRAEYANNGVNPSQMTATQVTDVVNDTLNTVPYTATCTTCHDPHAKTGNLSVSGKEVQLYQPESESSTTGIAPGATATEFTNMPPGLANPQICGQCHNGRATNGADASLLKSTSRSVMQSDQLNTLLGVGGAEDWDNPPPKRTSTHATVPGQCAQCHMPSSSHTFVASYDGCGPCHTPAAAAAAASSLQAEVSSDLLALFTRMSNWAISQGWSPQSWDFTSNIPAGQTVPSQADIPPAVLRARYNYYFIVNSGDLGVHNYAYTLYLLNWSNTTLTSASIPQVDMSQINKIPATTRIQEIKQVRANLLKSGVY